jgi:hypothetical protein
LIAKIREIPRRIVMNESLLERLRHTHTICGIVKADLATRKAVYRGEL